MGRDRSLKVQDLLWRTWKGLKSLGQGTVQAARRWVLRGTALHVASTTDPWLFKPHSRGWP